jgi:type 2 lantibiotic biosynthesis protein LanM
VNAWWASALYPGEVRQGAAGLPDWADLVERVLVTAPEAGEWPPERDAASGGRVFAHPLRPFLAVTRSRFEASLGEGLLATAVDLHAVWGQLEVVLEGRLGEIAARTMVLEMHTARRSGTLRGKTGADRFADFLRLLSGRDALSALFDRYPVLARLLGETCLRTTEAIVELLQRFTADRALLVSGLLAGGPLGRLVEVTPGSGDVHAGGRSVTLLGFDDGRRLVYKPRPLGLQARWGELLGWFAEIQPELAPRAVEVLPRDGYGWAEFVPALPCREQGEVELFYRRQGVLLALLYALDATDMHCENLIACADQPVIVDVETLFHPAWSLDTQNGPDPAMAQLNRSVMRTALLPKMLLGEHGALDVSAFGAETGAEYPVELPRWADAGTDSMRLVHGRVPFAGGSNRPVLSGDAVDPNLYRESLLSGFRVGYESIVDHRDELTGEGGILARFAGEEIRLVMRATQTYAVLLAEATHPDLFVSGDARQRAFDPLTEDTGNKHLAPLTPHEIDDLRAGDVPMFTTFAGSTDVRTTRGHHLPSLLVRSGLARALDKIGLMGAVDRRQQEWLIDATLATKQKRVVHGSGEPLSGTVAAVVPDSQRILALASGIGDDLVARACHDGERANWLGLELVDGRHWTVLPMGAGLAEGYCGTALFLAQLGRLTGTSRYSELAAKAVRTLPMLIAVLVEHPELAREVGSGGFFGLGGITYAIARIANLLGDHALAACLPAALAALAAADTAKAGVGEGTAGALAAVLAVHAETGLPEAAALAGTFAAKLASSPPPAAPGFLWGRAGTGWALGHPTPALAGVGACAPSDGLSWCSGLAGMVLAAHPAGLPGQAGRPVAIEHDRAAGLADGFAAAVSERVPSRDQSLCHGELGTLEALVVLAEHGHEASASALTVASARLLGAIEQHGIGCGTPHGVPSPGLLTGTAGIGFGLLRVGFAATVPSVLLLRPAGRNELHIQGNRSEYA